MPRERQSTSVQDLTAYADTAPRVLQHGPVRAERELYARAGSV
jgi:hypothetical protein